MSDKHARYSPSSAHRWGACPASVAASLGIPDGETIDAASGTLTHKLAAEQLATDCGIPPPASYLGTKIKQGRFEFVIDQERLDRVQTYVQAIEREPGIRFVEQYIPLDGVLNIPDQGGTADAVMLDAVESTLSVHDLKDGSHVVWAKDNPQLILYAAGALERYNMLHEWTKIRVCIHQPRAGHFDEHTYTREELALHVGMLRMAAQFADGLLSATSEQIRAAMRPGETQCHWCRIAGTCAARTESMLAQFPKLGPEVGPEVFDRQVLTLDDAQLAAALDRTAEIENCCNAIRKAATQRALAGHDLPGFKVVQGKRGARKWKTDGTDTGLDPIIDALRMMLSDDEIWERELVSPTTAEKLLKGKGGITGLAPLITQSDGALSVARADDPRPHVTVTKLEFEPVT